MARGVLRGLATAAVLAAGCGHPLGQTGDGGPVTDGPGEATAVDGSHEASPTDAPRDTSAIDLGAESPPPPGFIPCGTDACDPVSQYCYHSISGLTAGNYACQPSPASCAGQAPTCGCLLPDGGPPFCSICKAVTGTDATGLELDCPGPVG